MKFSVVINTYNRKNHLEKCLQSLKYLTHENFEVIVVNGPSDDGTAQLLDSIDLSIVKLDCEKANLSLSRNIGIANASGEIVAFLDDDAIPLPNWLEQLQLGYRDKRVAGVGGYVWDHTGSKFQCRVVVCDRLGDSQGYDSLNDANVFHEPGCLRYLSLTGCNSSFKKSALEEIGGFDEEYAYFLDETDVCLRLVDAGYDLTVVGGAQVHHKYAASHLRDNHKIPTSLYVQSRSKSYFSEIYLGKSNPDLISDHLAQYYVNLKKDNRWLAENKHISGIDEERLNSEVLNGIRDGIVDAHHFPHGRHNLSQNVARFDKKFVPFILRNKPTNRLKLCMVSREYPPGPVGGIGKWTQLIAEGLALRGHEVSVIAQSNMDHATVDFINSVWVSRIIPKDQSSRPVPPLPDLPDSIKNRSFSIYDEIQRIRLERGLNLISAPIWDLEGLVALEDNTIPCVLSLHTSYALSLPFHRKWKEDHGFYKNHVSKIIAAEKYALTKNYNLLANGSTLIKDMEERYQINIDPDIVTTIPHGIQTPKLKSKTRNSNNRIKVVFVGRFERRKGIDLLLDAIPEIFAQYKDIEFYLIGEHLEDEKYWTTFSEKWKTELWFDQVHILGKIDDTEKEQCLENADIFVAPSRYESFGLIFIEAMAHSLPCVALDVGGAKEIIEDGVDGLLVEPDNVAALSNAIIRLAQDEKTRLQMQRRASEKFAEKYTAEKMIDQVESYYQSIVNG